MENTDTAQELVGLNGDVDINPVLFLGSVHREGKGFAVALARTSVATEAELVIGNEIAIRVAQRGEAVAIQVCVAAQLVDAFCLFCVEKDIRDGKGMVIIVTTALHEIALALMTEFIGGDEISIRVTGPFACAILFFTNIACIVVRGSRFSGGCEMDSIRIVHVGRGGDERESSQSGFTYALKWEKIPSKVTNRALRSGKSGCRGNKRGSHL